MPGHFFSQNGKRATLAHRKIKNHPALRSKVNTFDKGESLLIRFTMAQIALPRIK
jgi:hypothetical protein